jgi:hypothetical protein
MRASRRDGDGGRPGDRGRRGQGTGSVVARLSAVDHELLALLEAHRVLTTQQLVSLLARPERTVDYRLQRLRGASLVDRTRPYAASGSAPFSWWLTRSGAKLVGGSSPAPGTATPNPLFLRHTTAIAGLYVALRAIGPDLGLSCARWRRDEQSWEQWSDLGRTDHLRPDAYLEIALLVDGTPGVAGAFIEIDFATMDQARLRAKVARYRHYAANRAWWGIHPGCPALLLLTTSEARVTRFLAAAERDGPRPSPFAALDPTRPGGLVAACAAVSSPEEALSGPVWRTSAADAGTVLASLLAGEVRTYRRVVCTWHEARAAAEREQRARAVEVIARDRRTIAEAIGGDGATALEFLFGHEILHRASQEQWALEHLALVEATLAWWERPGRRGPVPPEVSTGWRARHRSLWSAQAEALLKNTEAIARRDPRCRRVAACLSRGELVEPWRLEVKEPVDGERLAEELAAKYVARRDAAVEEQWHALALRRRIVTSAAQLADAYDTTHLVACVDCGTRRHVPDLDEWGRGSTDVCPSCGGALVSAASDPVLPPPLEDSLATIEHRLHGSRTGPERLTSVSPW